MENAQSEGEKYALLNLLLKKMKFCSMSLFLLIALKKNARTLYNFLNIIFPEFVWLIS